MFSRRTLLVGAGCGLVVGASRAAPAPAPAAWDATALRAALAGIEHRSRGRLGVSILDTASGERLDWQGDQRFPMCSTFKFLLCAAVLERVDRGDEQLALRLPIGKSDLVVWSPVTESRVGRDASIEELCAASMVRSDNTAANLLLRRIGGPAGLTAFLRRIGDPDTRLDRIEPDLNSALAGDARDTTTPSAMVDDLRRLLLADVLRPSSRERLTGWLLGNETGDARLRAGLPAGWHVGDKTGTGGNGTTNDIAIVWPPGQPPVLVAVYVHASPLTAPERELLHADVAKALGASWI